MYLSVIIPTFNRSKLLGDALLSFIKQDLPSDRFEILVIDNNSTDDTKTVVENLIKENRFNIKYFFESGVGLLAGRHRGFFESKGDVLVYSDDDIIADVNYLKNIIKTFEADSSVGLLTGKVLPRFVGSDLPDWAKSLIIKTNGGWYLDFLSIMDLGDDKKEIPYNLVFGCSFIVKKELVKKCGGFHPDCMPKGLIKYEGGGETVLAKNIGNLGMKIVYDPLLKIEHVVSLNRLTPEYFYHRTYIEGIKYSTAVVRKSRGINMKQFIFNLASLLKNLVLFSLSKNKDSFSDKKLKMFRSWGFVGHHIHAFFDSDLVGYILRENYFNKF